MVLILLFIVLPAIAIILAVIADKRKAKFFFGMRPDEFIQESADGVIYYQEGKVLATTGIMYVTNKRLVFFKYRYKGLGFIPFVGEMLEAIFIDKNVVFEIQIQGLKSYKFQKKVIFGNRNRTVIGVNCAVSLITRYDEIYKLNMPMFDTTKDKPALLYCLDILLFGNK